MVIKLTNCFIYLNFQAASVASTSHSNVPYETYIDLIEDDDDTDEEQPLEAPSDIHDVDGAAEATEDV